MLKRAGFELDIILSLFDCVIADTDVKTRKHRKFTALERFWRGFKDSILKKKGVDSDKLIPYMKEYACRQDRSPAQIRSLIYEELILPEIK